jgi:hypothetical protein
MVHKESICALGNQDHYLFDQFFMFCSSAVDVTFCTMLLAQGSQADQQQVSTYGTSLYFFCFQNLSVFLRPFEVTGLATSFSPI